MRSSRPAIRLCEWGEVSVADLSSTQRRQISDTVCSWAETSNLPDIPLSFSGPDGSILTARQYIGVVEVEGCTIEIYPKLDAELLTRETPPAWHTPETVMSNLLWMLEVCSYMDLKEADTAHLQEEAVRYYDLFAYLMAKNLRTELDFGVPHGYVDINDDSYAVRGRINILDQITRNWNRADKISCVWDEFTPNTPLNRIFKCSCRVLQSRVENPAAMGLLEECSRVLDEVEDIDPSTALGEALSLGWNRANDRFRRCFDMAVGLLAGSGYQLGHGTRDTFAFLLDMNILFETYVEAVLSAHFDIVIEPQKIIGYLFNWPKRSIQQIPDYVWKAQNHYWLGDAKYKHLASGQPDAVVFDLEKQLPGTEEASVRADRVLIANDVRQLTVYAEILQREKELAYTPPVAILYPFVGTGAFVASRGVAWNGSEFWLVPVRIMPMENLADAVPPFSFDTEIAAGAAR